MRFYFTTTYLGTRRSQIFSSSLSTVKRIAVCSPLSASESRTLEKQSRGPCWFIIDRVSSIDALCFPIGCLYRSVGYSESALGGTKLLPDLLLSVSRFSFRGLPPVRAAEKGSGTDVNSRPDAQRPLVSGNVSRVVSRIFKRRENLIKARNTPTVIFFIVPR